MKQDDGFDKLAEEVCKSWMISGRQPEPSLQTLIANALRQVSKEAEQKQALLYHEACMKNSELVRENTEWMLECNRLKQQVEALTLSVGILNKRLMRCMELVSGWAGYIHIQNIKEETEEFLKGQQ